MHGAKSGGSGRPSGWGLRPRRSSSGQVCDPGCKQARSIAKLTLEQRLRNAGECAVVRSLLSTCCLPRDQICPVFSLDGIVRAKFFGHLKHARHDSLRVQDCGRCGSSQCNISITLFDHPVAQCSTCVIFITPKAMVPEGSRLSVVHFALRVGRRQNSVHDPSPRLLRLVSVCRCLAVSRKPVSSCRVRLN